MVTQIFLKFIGIAFMECLAIILIVKYFSKKGEVKREEMEKRYFDNLERVLTKVFKK